MSGTDGDTLAGFRLDPAPQRPPARENQTVRTLAVDHGEFDFFVKRRCSDGLPHAYFYKPAAGLRLDLAQVPVVEKSRWGIIPVSEAGLPA